MATTLAAIGSAIVGGLGAAGTAIGTGLGTLGSAALGGLGGALTGAGGLISGIPVVGPTLGGLLTGAGGLIGGAPIALGLPGAGLGAALETALAGGGFKLGSLLGGQLGGPLGGRLLSQALQGALGGESPAQVGLDIARTAIGGPGPAQGAGEGAATISGARVDPEEAIARALESVNERRKEQGLEPIPDEELVAIGGMLGKAFPSQAEAVGPDGQRRSDRQLILESLDRALQIFGTALQQRERERAQEEQLRIVTPRRGFGAAELPGTLPLRGLLELIGTQTRPITQGALNF
jgi:hypothetical protein